MAIGSNHRTDIIGHGTARTLPGLFRERAARSPDAIAYREWNAATRQRQDYSWRYMARLVRRWQAALHGAALEEGDRVAIQLPNGTGWVAFDIAAMASGLMTVPIYSYDSLSNAARILANSGARLMVLDSSEQWAALAPRCFRFPDLRKVWVRRERADMPKASSASPAVAPLADALSSRTEAIREPELAADATATLWAGRVLRRSSPSTQNAGRLQHQRLASNAQAPNTASAAILGRISHLLCDLSRHAQIRAVHLVLEPWTIQQGLLTPTLKIKRQAIEERYAGEIALLYEALKEARQGLAAGRASAAPGSPNGVWAGSTWPSRSPMTSPRTTAGEASRLGLA